MNIFKINKKRACPNLPQGRGFTLIELLVVISIISLLTSIVLSSLNDAKKKARDTARIREMHEVRTALQLFFADNGYYPPNTGLDANHLAELRTALTTDSKYISTISDAVYYSARNTINDEACMEPSGCPSFHLAIVLENSKSSVLDGDSDGNTNIAGRIWLAGKSTGSCRGFTGYVESTPDTCYDIIP